MDNTVIIAIIGWLFPGGGHLVQKRIKRGITIAVVFWSMFAVAVWSGGAYYPGFDFKDGQLLYLLNVFARLGSGLGAIVSWVASGTPDPDVAARATFEYGGRFLEIAGLINFLAVMDSVDISLGRKK